MKPPLLSLFVLSRIVNVGADDSIANSQANEAILNSSPQSDTTEKTHQQPSSHLPTLAYVTPWNPSGMQMTEKYRDRLEMVSPVWYTVHVSTASTSSPSPYTISGGPPSPADAEWAQRLQAGSKPLRVVPRFLLDGWTNDDYRDLLFNTTRAELLASALLTAVREKAYDGLVFESGATAFLGHALAPLSDALRGAGKLLVLVLPPMQAQSQASASGEAQAQAAEYNRGLRRAFGELTGLADFFTVMTYDMTGPGGVACDGHGRARCPGANSDAAWVRENLEGFAEAAGAPRTRRRTREVASSDFAGLEDDDDDDDGGGGGAAAGFGFRASLGAGRPPKFLMGFPLYGYKYPIKSRDAHGPDAAVLRGAGEPFVMSELAAEHAAARAAGGVQTTDGGEEYFDYEREDGAWRAYVQSAGSVKSVKGVVADVLAGFEGLEGGLALWEMGQPTEELLDSL